ncbi:MAG: HYR domain-containing protein [Saprospiraceae bacterium]
MKILNTLMCTTLLVCLSFNSFSFSENNSTNFCSLDCNGQINLSLPETGFTIVTPSMMSSASGCPGVLEVHIMDANGVDIGNIVDCNYVGQILMVSVVHPTSGNSCWGSILIEDKLKPTINCIDIEIDCNENTSPANTGIPNISDNCFALPNPTYVDVMENLDCADPQFKAIIKRTWTVTDINGNTNSCEQNIFIKNLDISLVMFPPATTVDCNNLNLDPSITGEPMVNGTSIGASCNLTFTKVDGNPFPTCGGGYKFFREWIVMDWCTNEIITGNQTIEVKDITPPTIICPNDFSTSTSSNDCTGSVILPMPIVSDDCSNYTVSVDFDFPLSGNIYSNIPTGTHPVTYTAIDDCGNSSSCTFNVIIKDLISPIAICDNPTQVSIGTDGTAKVCALTFDDGSTDNCGIDTFLVRRMDDSNFSDCVNFNCSDVGDTVMVVLRAIDECGNYNECMVEAIVDDQLSPTIVCPDDLTIECTELDNTIFTSPTLIDNCGLDSLYFVDDSSGLNTCNMTGVIIREWFAIDFGGLIDSCTQTLTVEDNAPLVFTFPPNDTISCAGTFDPNVTGRPTVTGGCNNIVETVLDSIRFNIDDCKEKLFITWGFFDNCADTFLLDTATQFILIADLEAPIMTCQDTLFTTPDFNDNCLEFIGFIATAVDSCSGIDTITNDYSPSFSPLGFSVAGNFPVGETTVTFNAFDFCGNEATCETVVIVEDITSPDILCAGVIQIQIPPVSGIATIDINDYPDRIFTVENCSNPAPPILDESSLDFGTVVSCTDFPNQFYDDNIIVTTTDAAGNSNSCTQTKLRYICASGLALAGKIETAQNESVDDVMVKVMSSPDSIMNFSPNGFYVNDDLTMGNNYTITPSKNINPLNGVTTYDLVLISKHILGTQLLDSPYKIIAADANRSGSVTALDLVALRSLILFSIDELPNNKSWRFVDSHYEFDNPMQPLLENFPESMECLNLTESELGMDFIGVKVGDVNGTASPNNFATIDTRNEEGEVILQVDNILLEKDKVTRIPIFAKNLEEITGFQFTLNFDSDQIELLNIEKNILEKENFGLKFQEKGAITCSWIKGNQNEILSQKPLFYLNFSAKKDLFLENNLWINSKYTSAEAYNIKNKIYSIDLLFEKNDVDLISHSDEVLVFQNQPNPFTTSTEIKFYLPQFTNVELQILDISGKIIHKYHTHYHKGIHQIDVDQNIFPSPGVYLYRLITPSFSASKKMILIN